MLLLFMDSSRRDLTIVGYDKNSGEAEQEITLMIVPNGLQQKLRGLVESAHEK